MGNTESTHKRQVQHLYPYLNLPQMAPADVLEAIKHMPHICQYGGDIPCAVCFVFGQVGVQNEKWAREHREVIEVVSHA